MFNTACDMLSKSFMRNHKNISKEFRKGKVKCDPIFET